MSTLKKLKTEAAKLGATVTKEKIGMTTTVEVFAPKGFYWAEGSTHVFVDDVYTGPNDYPDLLSRMSYGLVKCEDPDCEWCCEEIK
jgi:hypothetical protein